MSDKEKKKIFKQSYGDVLKEADKEVDKRKDNRTRSGNLTNEDYLALQNATRMPNQQTMIGALGGPDSDRAKRIAAQNAHDMARNGASRVAMGIMEGSSVLPTRLTDGFNYTDAQRNAIEQGRNTWAYRGGYMTGLASSAVLGGATGLESALAKTAFKAGTKSGVKKFMANRGADLILNSGINALDSVREATYDGQIDWTKAGKNMLLNEILDLGVGGLMEGASVGVRGTQVKKALTLKNKLEKGMTLDSSEVKLMNKINAREAEDAYKFETDAQAQLRVADEQGRVVRRRANVEAQGAYDAQEVGDAVRNRIRSMQEADRLASGERSSALVRNTGDRVRARLDELDTEYKARAEADESRALLGDIERGYDNPSRAESRDASFEEQARRSDRAENTSDGDKTLMAKTEEKTELTPRQKAQKAGKKRRADIEQGKKDVARLKREKAYYSKNLADEDTPSVRKQKIKDYNKQIAEAQKRAKGNLTSNNRVDIEERLEYERFQLEQARTPEVRARHTKNIADLEERLKAFDKSEPNVKPKAETSAEPKAEAKTEQKAEPKKAEGSGSPIEREIADAEAKVKNLETRQLHAQRGGNIAESVRLRKELLEARRTLERIQERTKTKAKPGAKAKAEAKAEAEPKPKAETKAETNGETKAEVKAEVKAGTEVEAKVETKAEGKAEAKAEEKPKKAATKEETDFAKKDIKAKKKAVEDKVKEKMGDGDFQDVEDFLKRVDDAEEFVIKASEDPRLSATYVKIGKQIIEMMKDTEKAVDLLGNMQMSGSANKRVFKGMKKAVEDAETDVKADFDTVYNRVMSTKVTDDGLGVKTDPYQFSAESGELLNVLMRRFNDTGSLDDLDKIIALTEKNIAVNSERGHSLAACKLLYRETPAGRYRLAQSELKRLNTKFKDRLNEPLTLTKDEIRAIYRAETSEEIDKVFEALNKRLWNDIPSTAWEKFNEWRHFTMLSNPKTHMRNLVGNGVFFFARSIADCIEYTLSKGAMKAIGKDDVKFVKGYSWSFKEMEEHKEFLEDAWNEWYKKSQTRSRFIETQRPDGLTEIRFVPISKAVNLNYKALEKEDLWFLTPEFKHSMIRYCKAHDIPMDGSATPLQLKKAMGYAGEQAQIATYRDASAVSDMLTGLKQKTAGAKGKTMLGRAGYRGVNMVLESQLPFVKTPVNIFRRMMDYSPVGIMRSLGDMERFVLKKDYDALEQAIHYFSTGLTGSGVMVGGALLASRGLLMTKAGQMSGDEYYDRDMGFQDYSLMLPNGSPLLEGHSLSLDWVAPMATALFMGATAYEQLSADGFELDDITQGLGAVTNPMMEMSFMSSSKDLLETFLENAVDRSNGETHWSDAAFNALCGSVPQGYMTSMFSNQFMSQMANTGDKYQRDTSSTKEGAVAKSWDRWYKQLINRVPWARQKLLEKKVNRRGEDVKTTGGDNLLTRLMFNMVSPATVKKISYDDTDREIIKIYNELPTGTDSEQKKKAFFFYNFTGNPSYDLGNGRRMTNHEKYLYTAENRKQQNTYIKQMLKDEAYGDMTANMKAEELNVAHWLSTTQADRKIYGDKYAIRQLFGSKQNGAVAVAGAVAGDQNTKASADRDAYDAVIYGTKGADKKKAEKDFLDFYILKEKTVAQTHDTSYYTKALAVAEFNRRAKAKKDTDPQTAKNAEKMALAYNVYDSKMEAANTYIKKGGSMKEYTTAMKRVMSGIDIMGASTSQRNKAVSAGAYEKGTVNERTYRAMGLDADMSNMGYGLSQKFDHKYTLKELNGMVTELKMQYNVDKNSSLSKEEIIGYIETLSEKQGREISEAEKACLYRYFYTYNSKKNPYGKIPNFLGGEDTSDGSGGWSSWGRRGRGWGHRRRGGGGGSGKEGAGSYAAWLKANGYTAEVENIAGGKKTSTGKSNLTEAFRKKQLKTLQNSTGRWETKGR